jgi:hypothetical protein
MPTSPQHPATPFSNQIKGVPAPDTGITILASLDLSPIPPYVSLVLNVKKKKPRRKALLLGLGLDSDGHKRLTKGPNFALLGGTEETHEAMTEKAIKINEKLASKGKQLEDVSREEFDDIAESVGLRRPGAK